MRAIIMLIPILTIPLLGYTLFHLLMLKGEARRQRLLLDEIRRWGL
jgi:hypothetical protein